MGGNGNGYVQLRRGIHDDKHRPKLAPLRFAAYVHLIIDAEKSTGVVVSSAKSLAARYGFTERGARETLEALEKHGYIRRFPVQGKHGEYPILVNRYRITTGAMSGLMLNAFKSEGLAQLVYEPVRDDSVNGSGDDSGNVGVVIPPPNNKKKREEQSTTSSSPSANDATRSTPVHAKPPKQPGEFEDLARSLVPFYLTAVNRQRYDLDAQSEISRKQTRLQFIAAKAREIADRVVKAGGTQDEATLIQNTKSAMEHVITVFARNEWRSTEGRKFNGMEYAFRDFGRIESALEEAA